MTELTKHYHLLIYHINDSRTEQLISNTTWQVKQDAIGYILEYTSTDDLSPEEISEMIRRLNVRYEFITNKRERFKLTECFDADCQNHELDWTIENIIEEEFDNLVQLGVASYNRIIKDSIHLEKD